MPKKKCLTKKGSPMKENEFYSLKHKKKFIVKSCDISANITPTGRKRLIATLPDGSKVSKMTSQEIFDKYKK